MLREPQAVPDDTPREIAEIIPELRATLRLLVSGETPWPLFLTGKAGRGKTAAVLCLCDYVAGSLFFRFTRLLKAFEWSRAGSVKVPRWMPISTSGDEKRQHLSFDSLNEHDFWRRLATCPLVVIDDLATRGGYTEPQYDQFYDLLEERKRKPTVVVSNLSLAQLGEVFDDRIVSRLARGTIFTLAGVDRRLGDR